MPAADGNTRGRTAGSQLTGIDNCETNTGTYLHTNESILLFVTTWGPPVYHTATLF